MEPAEIDADGISAALTTAALRALDQLTVPVDAIILDGSVDTISAALQARPAPAVRVLVKVGADRDCVSVAAASILAKVHRDALMVELDAQAPEYGWARNKGYGSAEHREAIARLGAHEQHRRSWRLGTGAPVSSSDRVRTARAPEPPVSAPGVLWEGDWPRAEREESP